MHAERKLPALPSAEGGVVMRFAPNPSGPLHLGHARAAVLNDAYVRKYGGSYILRIEDTDPKRVDPDAYAMVQEDIAWLGLGITEVIYQSDRLDIYYDLRTEADRARRGVCLHLRERAVPGIETGEDRLPLPGDRDRGEPGALAADARRGVLRGGGLRPGEDGPSSTPTRRCGTFRRSGS